MRSDPRRLEHRVVHVGPSPLGVTWWGMQKWSVTRAPVGLSSESNHGSRKWGGNLAGPHSGTSTNSTATPWLTELANELSDVMVMARSARGTDRGPVARQASRLLDASTPKNHHRQQDAPEERFSDTVILR